MNPTCVRCEGTGMCFAAPCPYCNGAGRAALPENASKAEWVRWIREQSTIEDAEAILDQYLAAHASAPPSDEAGDEDGTSEPTESRRSRRR
jgi:hypothetical protein